MCSVSAFFRASPRSQDMPHTRVTIRAMFPSTGTVDLERPMARDTTAVP